MVFDRLKRSITRDTEGDDIPKEEFVEVGVGESRIPGKIGISIEKLDDFADTDRILKVVREGIACFPENQDAERKGPRRAQARGREAEENRACAEWGNHRRRAGLADTRSGAREGSEVNSFIVLLPFDF